MDTNIEQEVEEVNKAISENLQESTEDSDDGFVVKTDDREEGQLNEDVISGLVINYAIEHHSNLLDLDKAFFMITKGDQKKHELERIRDISKKVFGTSTTGTQIIVMYVIGFKISESEEKMVHY